MLASSWVVIVDISSNKILLGKRSRGSNSPGSWNFFGGGIESSEEPLTAAARELKEELGVNAAKSQLVNLGKLKVSKDKQGHFFLMFVSSQRNYKPNPKEISKVKWFKLNNFPDKLHLPTRLFIKSKMYALVLNEIKKFHENVEKVEAMIPPQALAALPKNVHLRDVMDVLQPVINEYRQQVETLRLELDWAYRTMDSITAVDYYQTVESGISSYSTAVQALGHYTRSWFAEQPLSYQELSNLARLLKQRLLQYLKEPNIPEHIERLVVEDYRDVIQLRVFLANNPERELTEEDL